VIPKSREPESPYPDFKVIKRKVIACDLNNGTVQTRRNWYCD
jgi:hypothetical protein